MCSTVANRSSKMECTKYSKSTESFLYNWMPKQLLILGQLLQLDWCDVIVAETIMRYFN
jgi:hypothetical protein